MKNVKTLNKFGIFWIPTMKINDVTVYEALISEPEYEAFKRKKGYRTLPLSRGLEYVAPKGHTISSKYLEIVHAHGPFKGKLTMSINRKEVKNAV